MISFSIWQYKELTFGQYRKILIHLDSFYDINLVVTAPRDERSQAQELINHSSTWALNMAGRTTTIEMVCQLSLTAMVISIDNSAKHISLAVNMPNVNIFGPTSANNWAHRGNQHHTITNTMPCIPCGSIGCNGSGEARCLLELAPKSICDATDSHIKLTSGIVNRKR